MNKSNSDPVTLFLRGILALGRRVRAERPPDSVSLSGLSILGSLNQFGPIVATRLAAEERLQPQSLTRLLADLEHDRLITRKRNKSDRRQITIAITEKGRKVLFEDIAARREWLETAMNAALSQQERKVILSASVLMMRLASYRPT